LVICRQLAERIAAAILKLSYENAIKVKNKPSPAKFKSEIYLFDHQKLSPISRDCPFIIIIENQNYLA